MEFSKSTLTSKQLSEKLQAMKGFRNILVHRYGEINNETAYNNIKQGLIDFEAFIAAIVLFLEKHKENDRKK